MKKLYKNILFSVALLCGLVSCDFETENYQQIPIEDAYKTVQDVQNGMNGAYNALASYRFLGNYAVAYGDFCAGISNGDRGSGHFYYQSAWIISDTDAELEDMWNYGYKVIDRCTRTIKGGKEVIANAEALFLTNDEIAEVKVYIAQCYAMKALAYHYLVNLFALPYQGNENSLGLPLVKDEPIAEFVNIERATVENTYVQIKNDIQSAEDIMSEALAVNANLSPSEFYMGEAAIKALKARVYMFIGDYNTAKQAALDAIKLKDTGDGKGSDGTPADEIYLSMWTSLAISDEDIFTLAKNEADNLSANSLNTLYGSYGCTLTTETMKLFDGKDIRKELLQRTSIGKYQGLPTSAATSNIPILRKSEMSLLLAEIYAREGNIADAQDYLFYTAKRNKSIAASTELPNNTNDLLAFISDERIREFAGEGHRFYDARRMGDKILNVGTTPFDIKRFVFPIPAAEINAGFCNQQNDGWDNNLPE